VYGIGLELSIIHLAVHILFMPSALMIAFRLITLIFYPDNKKQITKAVSIIIVSP